MRPRSTRLPPVDVRALDDAPSGPIPTSSSTSTACTGRAPANAPESPLPPGGRYPNVPTLVLNGELDIRTDVYQAREVARNFPRSTYLEASNMGHVTALYDADACASVIVRRFVQTLATGDTSCLGRLSEHRLVQRFAERVADAPQATVASGADRSSAADRRAAWVAVETLADVVDRWYAIPGFTGSGLYGGKFKMTSTDGLPFTSRVWTVKLTRRPVDDGRGGHRHRHRAAGRGHGDRVALSVGGRDGGGRPHGDVVDARAAGAGAYHRNHRRTRDRPDPPGAFLLVTSATRLGVGTRRSRVPS